MRPTIFRRLRERFRKDKQRHASLLLRIATLEGHLSREARDHSRTQDKLNRIVFTSAVRGPVQPDHLRLAIEVDASYARAGAREEILSCAAETLIANMREALKNH